MVIVGRGEDRMSKAGRLVSKRTAGVYLTNAQLWPVMIVEEIVRVNV